ncbi:MAG: cytochrome c oxidase subunit 4 [Acidimicrobiales bacterium]
MRVEALLLLGVGVFFAVVGVVYWFWGYEQGGTMMLIGTVALGLVPGSYYLWWARRMKPRPEDRADGALSEGAGVIGSFPSSSVWPFVFAMGIFLVVLALVFGTWLMGPGFALVLSAAVGYSVESRRGGNV